MGAVCAIRHRVPLVEYPGLETSPFHGRATATNGDVLGALDEAVSNGSPHAIAATNALRQLPHLADADTSKIFATAERDGSRLHLVVHLPDDLAANIAGHAVTAMIRAVRAYDPYVPVIDVSMAGR
jgi:hypothetical protein